LATGIRSNGIILSGFFIFNFLKKEISLVNFYFLTNQKEIILTVIQIIITILPFVSFQYFGYLLYCTTQNQNEMIRPWCSFLYPNLYGFVQNEYWKVGFLKYYQWKQIPNFLLASPVIFLSFYGVYLYYLRNKKSFLSLGFRKSEKSKMKKGNNFFNDEILVFIYYWFFLLIYLILNVHVQIITRFFSSMPPLFWFASYLFSKKKNWWRVFILGYFIFYSFLGCILFSNFYPWT
jgi:GPI mannosyltransferase 2